MIKKSLVHLGYLGRVAYHAITPFEKAQAVAVATAVDRSTLERLATPSTAGGQRVPGLRVGAPRTMRILATLGCAGLSFKAFSNAEFRTVLVEQMGTASEDATPARVGYELRKLPAGGISVQPALPGDRTPSMMRCVWSPSSKVAAGAAGAWSSTTRTT